MDFKLPPKWYCFVVEIGIESHLPVVHRDGIFLLNHLLWRPVIWVSSSTLISSWEAGPMGYVSFPNPCFQKVMMVRSSVTSMHIPLPAATDSFSRRCALILRAFWICFQDSFYLYWSWKNTQKRVTATETTKETVGEQLKSVSKRLLYLFNSLLSILSSLH